MRLNSEMERVTRELSGLDATLAKAAGIALARLRINSRNSSAKRRGRGWCATNTPRVTPARFSGLVCPERHLQERLYSIVPFVAKHGFDLIEGFARGDRSGMSRSPADCNLRR